LRVVAWILLVVLLALAITVLRSSAFFGPGG
jgi:hypothetical protein